MKKKKAPHQKLVNQSVNVKPLTAFAIVSIEHPQLYVNDIYETDEVGISPGEQIIKVTITPHI